MRSLRVTIVGELDPACVAQAMRRLLAAGTILEAKQAAKEKAEEEAKMAKKKAG